MQTDKQFPNGFDSWHETHFEVVDFILETWHEYFDGEEKIESAVSKKALDQGRGGLYELANELTDKFELKYQGGEWNGEFFDVLQEFLQQEIYN